MDDRRNSVFHRAGFVLLPQGSNPIALGEVGEYLDLNNIRWQVAADGSARQSGGTFSAIAPIVRLATAAALPSYVYSSVTKTITASANGAWTIDGKTLTVNDRILVNDGVADTDNGIFVVTVKGTASIKTVLTRAPDMNTSGSIAPGMLIPIGPDGLTNDGNVYQLVTPGPITLDASPLLFNVDASTQSGVIPSARMAFSAFPANTDPMAIGGKTFQFLTALGASGANVQVLRGANAAASLANVIDAINGNVATQGTAWVEATVPFAVAVVADASTGTQLRIRKAVARGGAAIAGVMASTLLTCTNTAGATAWNVTNLNASGLFPKVTITAAMVTFGSFDVEYSAAIGALIAQVMSSTGVLRSQTDAITIVGNTVHVALAGGASPAIQATDVVTFLMAGT